MGRGGLRGMDYRARVGPGKRLALTLFQVLHPALPLVLEQEARLFLRMALSSI